MKKSQNSRNKVFPYYFCLVMEGSGAGARSVAVTIGSQVSVGPCRLFRSGFLRSTLPSTVSLSWCTAAAGPLSTTSLSRWKTSCRFWLRDPYRNAYASLEVTNTIRKGLWVYQLTDVGTGGGCVWGYSDVYGSVGWVHSTPFTHRPTVK